MEICDILLCVEKCVHESFICFCERIVYNLARHFVKFGVFVVKSGGVFLDRLVAARLDIFEHGGDDFRHFFICLAASFPKLREKFPLGGSVRRYNFNHIFYILLKQTGSPPIGRSAALYRRERGVFPLPALAKHRQCHGDKHKPLQCVCTLSGHNDHRVKPALRHLKNATYAVAALTFALRFATAQRSFFFY